MKTRLSHYVKFENHGRPETWVLIDNIHYDLTDGEMEDVLCRRAIDGREFTLRAFCQRKKLYIAEMPADVNCEDWSVN